jgi:hypothetical protein
MSLRRRGLRAIVLGGLAAHRGSDIGGDRNAGGPGAHDPAVRPSIQEGRGQR